MAECPECGTKVKAAPGKLVRCPECQTPFRVPGEEPAAKKPVKPASKPVAKPKPAPTKTDPAKPPPPPPTEEEVYGFSGNEDLAETRRLAEEAAKKKLEEKAKSDKPILQVKRKNIGDLEVWAKIDKSMIWLQWGIIVWAAAHFFYGIVLFLGMVQGPEYAGPVVRCLIRPEQPPFELGQGDSLDRPGFVIAMLGGMNMTTVTFVLLLLIELLGWTRMGLWMAGYGIAWQAAPEEAGGRGQLITLFSLGGFNFVINFFLIFLPLVGAYGYTLMPLWGSEMAMAEFNMERTLPLHVFWSYAPFWEELFTFIIWYCRFFEPIMIAYFVWTVGSVIKDDPLEETALGTLKMGFAILFLFMAYQLFALTGSSPVLVKLLRVLYLAWYAFFVVWLLRLSGMVARCRQTFYFYFHPEDD